MPHNAPISPLSVLVVYGDIAAGTTLARSGAAMIEKLRARGYEVILARSAADAVAAIQSDPLTGCVIVDADLDHSEGAETVLRAFRACNDRTPAFLFGQRSQIPAIPLEHAQDGRRVRLAHRGHADVHCGPRRGRHSALPREPAAADVLRHARAGERARLRVRHAGAPGRHGVSEDSGVEGVLRLLRREPVSLGPLDRHGRRGLAARSQRADRREREVRGARVRLASLLHRHQRHFELQPHHLHGEPHAGRRRAVRPQLPQVHRARLDHEPGDARVPRAAPQPLRHHRPDLPRGLAARRPFGRVSTRIR